MLEGLHWPERTHDVYWEEHQDNLEGLADYASDLNFELRLSSTSAMTSELERAMDNEEEIVVPRWTPFWASAKYDVR